MASLFLTVPLLILALLITRRIYHATSNISQTWSSNPRPPLMPSWIPFVGNAFGTASGDQFWRDTEKTYGPAIRILAMGDERVFLTSGPLIQWVYKKSKAFNFYEVRKSIFVNMWGGSKSISYSLPMEEKLMPNHTRAMQPGAIKDSLHRYGDYLFDYMTKRIDEAANEGKEVDMVDFAYEILFKVSSEAYFSPSFPSAKFHQPFMAFDRVLPVLALDSLPKIAKTPANRIRENMAKMLAEWWSTTTEEDHKLMGPSITCQWEVAEEEGWGVNEFAICLLAELWTLEANAPFAGIWAAAQIARRPQLQAILRDEVNHAISGLSPPTLSTLLHLPNQDIINALPRIQAVFQETLRFHTASFSIRIVTEDITLPARLCGEGIGAKQGLKLYAGEYAVGVTRASHVDPNGEWGADVDQFDPERFLSQGEKRPAMMPFGGGTSMCEGRHFASTEILTFIATFVHLCEMTVISDALEPDYTRIALGAMQPGKGKMKVRIAKRSGV